MYGWEYLGDIIQGCRGIGAEGCQSTTAVINAMVDAIFSGSPKCRYLIHGGRHIADKWAVSIINTYDGLSICHNSKASSVFFFFFFLPQNLTFINTT